MQVLLPSSSKMELWAWGSNSYGQLGLGTRNEQFEVPQRVDLPQECSSVQSLGAGGGHSLVVDQHGVLWSTGWNCKGQLGIGSNDVSTCAFTRVEHPKDVVRVFCGWDFSVVITRSGQVFSCGSNAFGQLGREKSILAINKFEIIPTLKSRVIVDVACGLRHTLFLDDEGQVFGCGSTKKGQLGLGQTIPPIIYVPSLLTGIPKICAVRTGQNFSVLVPHSQDEVFCFGDNKYGQFGISPDVTGAVVSSPFRVSPKYSTVSCGWTHTVALSEDGTAKTFGRNCYGQLGRANSTVGIPMAIEKFKFEKVSAGYEHVLAIDQSGKLYSWGWNEHGNCGNGSTMNSELPGCVLFDTSRKVRQCFGGSGHSFALVQKTAD